MRLINAFTEINISPEILFVTPPWIRRDFMRVTDRAIGASRDDGSLSRIADLVFEGRYFGTYFRNIGGDKEELARLLRESDRSPRGIFEALLRFDAARRNKRHIGAKFPVHIVCAQELFDWYPDARVIHLHRHPLAIYSSQKRKHLVGKAGISARAATTIKVFVATIVSCYYSHRFFRRNQAKPNYILFQYEDLVSEPEPQVERLCRFLGVRFQPDMLGVPAKGSSHGHSSGYGIHAKSRDAWRHDVNALERTLFRVLTDSDWRAARQ